MQWIYDRILAERPKSVSDINGKIVPQLPDLLITEGIDVVSVGKPADPRPFNRVVTKGRWPKVDVVLIEMAGTPNDIVDMDAVLETWERARNAARKTVLAHIPFGADEAFTSDGHVHRSLPGIVASNGHGLYAVLPLG